MDERSFQNTLLQQQFLFACGLKDLHATCHRNEKHNMQTALTACLFILFQEQEIWIWLAKTVIEPFLTPSFRTNAYVL